MVKREAHIGTIVPRPDYSFLIDIPTVHLRNHLYDLMRDYKDTNKDPILYIPDTRILTPDSIRQIVSFLRIYPFVGVIACSRKEDDIPYLFRFILRPMFHNTTLKRIPLVEIVRDFTDDTEYLELVTELSDLGFFHDSRALYAKVLN